MLKVFKKINVLFLLLMMFSVSLKAQSSFCGLTNISFNDKEWINYKVYYNVGFIWISAGEANFKTKKEILKGRSVFHVIGTGSTYPSYDYFFKVRDDYQTWIDEETLLPLRFKRKVREGSYAYDNQVEFDHSNRKATSKNGVYKIPNCIQDVISAIYYARNIDYSTFKVGDKIPFDMFLDDEIFPLYIKYLGKETITTKYGTFNTIKIAPLLINGTLFKGGEDMVLYVSDDKNHIPVRISTPIIVGSIKADMMQFENLRYPLSSLVKKK